MARDQFFDSLYRIRASRLANRVASALRLSAPCSLRRAKYGLFALAIACTVVDELRGMRRNFLRFERIDLSVDAKTGLFLSIFAYEPAETNAFTTTDSCRILRKTGNTEGKGQRKIQIRRDIRRKNTAEHDKRRR